MIPRNIELEARLIDDIFDFTRIANGKLELRLDTVYANALVQRGLDIVPGDVSLSPPSFVLLLELRGIACTPIARVCSRSPGTHSRTPSSSRLPTGA